MASALTTHHWVRGGFTFLENNGSVVCRISRPTQKYENVWRVVAEVPNTQIFLIGRDIRELHPSEVYYDSAHKERFSELALDIQKLILEHLHQRSVKSVRFDDESEPTHEVYIGATYPLPPPPPFIGD